METRSIRDRAHIVCVDCHARKVKCDLQDQADSICKNCRRLGHSCIPRDGVRKRRKRTQAGKDSAQGTLPSVAATDAPSQTTSVPETMLEAIDSGPQMHKGFISPSTVMHFDSLSAQTDVTSPCSPPLDTRASILNLTKANVLPRPVVRQALIDAYFEYAYPFYPVVDRCDVTGPDSSILLQQAICLLGSMVQHDPESVHLSRAQYEKVKLLIYLNYESNNIAVLKTLCLVSCYSPLPTDQVTLDGPWHWLGVAIRMAIQMGLHQKSTYHHHPNPGCLRRIFWQLINSDRLATSCWGRPSAIPNSQEWDVLRLTNRDFPNPGKQAQFFMQGVELSAIFGAITREKCSTLRADSDEGKRVVYNLCDWLHNLPPKLCLYDSEGTRQPFWRPAVELHIWYFVTIILFQLLDRRTFPWQIASSSLVAASCISRLYEEILYREEAAHLLHIHGFFCMVAAVPLICYFGETGDVDIVRLESIDTLCRILNRMRIRYGGCGLVLRKIRRLQEEVKRGHCRASEGQGSENSAENMQAASIIKDRIQDLFPFPRSFCDALNLLGQNKQPDGNFGESYLDRMQDGLDPPASHESGVALADLLAMNCADFDFSFDIEGFGAAM